MPGIDPDNPRLRRLFYNRRFPCLLPRPLDDGRSPRRHALAQTRYARLHHATTVGCRALRARRFCAVDIFFWTFSVAAAGKLSAAGGGWIFWRIFFMLS